MFNVQDRTEECHKKETRKKERNKNPSKKSQNFLSGFQIFFYLSAYPRFWYLCFLFSWLQNKKLNKYLDGKGVSIVFGSQHVTPTSIDPLQEFIFLSILT